MINNVEAALEIGAIGIVGIFIFMLIFYAAIKLILKLFPEKENKAE
ncbi:MAG TPA: OadG-related small transporter subunit [Paludibacteraceae bacterium]|jgi:preprotein translocase subunit SecD|nr:hypothetical protein [Paludibacteraceae bacterium]MDS1031699.1 OadG-related small transporter subunit [Porphyromonadaceae sp. NP-X]NLJ21051.1 hypothetical protein [Bacteroidales bacterium]OPZ15680.1 MAG: hypothetical protein BWZ05_02249 [Bacteroidetes bacterium ADurb.BinA245]MBP9016432.1 hypothetical protein [Paludibacteraceae bacterium]